MTYKGAIDEVKMLSKNPMMPDIFKPSLNKIAETFEMATFEMETEIKPKEEWIHKEIPDLRDQFCNAVTKIFGDSMNFLDFLENEEYSSKYDCYLDYNGENYIINRETGEYINWYKLDHIGRSITISICDSRTDIPKWIEEFLVEFKESEEEL